MSTPKCVAVNRCEIKDIFDKDLKSAIFKQIKQTIRAQVDRANGLTFDDKCKDGWSLGVTVLALKVDNTDKPTSIEAKVIIDATPLDGSTHGFKAPGGSKATGINAKKMEDEAK